MTTNLFDGFKDAFKAVPTLDGPEAARDFVKRSVSTAKERAAEIQTGAEKVTGVVESAVSGSISEAAKVTRNIQQAMFEDADAFFSGLDKLISAKSFTEAVEIQSALLRERSEIAVARARSATDYVGKLIADTAKAAQDNIAQVIDTSRKVA